MIDPVVGGFLSDVASVTSQTERGRYYGTPAENHGCTGVMWSAYVSRRFGVDVEITARDVCMLNALQKISRDANKAKRDNLIDLAGYAENADRIEGGSSE